MDQKDIRKIHFLDFLSMYDTSTPLAATDGVYSYQDFSNTNSGITAKVIFLDTRTHRDNHFVWSVGEIHFPFTALLSAFIRLTLTSLGIGSEHTGDILGTEQWYWLEHTLSTSQADIHILVSSIQVSTSNPVVESWGHFPFAKKKLLNLFQKYDPSGLLLLSGDVHHAEISIINYTRADGSEHQWFEITSSGLTHTCRDSRLTKYICPLMLDTFSAHRVERFKYFMEKNFGLLTINKCIDHSDDSCHIIVNASVLSLESDRLITQLIRVPERGLPRSKVEKINISRFPRISDYFREVQPQSRAVYITIIVSLLLLLLVSWVKSCRYLSKGLSDSLVSSRIADNKNINLTAEGKIKKKKGN